MKYVQKESELQIHNRFSTLQEFRIDMGFAWQGFGSRGGL